MSFFRRRLAALALLMFVCGDFISASSPASEEQEMFATVEADLSSREKTSDLTGDAMTWVQAAQRFSINRDGAVFGFASGPSYFRTIALSNDSQGKRLEIKSYYSSEAPTSVFVPALIFLNGDSEIIETLPRPIIEIVSEAPEHVLVSEKIPESAAFAVIYTSENRVNTRLNFKSYSLSRHAPSPRIGSGNPKLSGSYEGTLSLSLDDS